MTVEKAKEAIHNLLEAEGYFVDSYLSLLKAKITRIMDKIDSLGDGAYDEGSTA